MANANTRRNRMLNAKELSKIKVAERERIAKEKEEQRKADLDKASNG